MQPPNRAARVQSSAHTAKNSAQPHRHASSAQCVWRMLCKRTIRYEAMLPNIDQMAWPDSWLRDAVKLERIVSSVVCERWSGYALCYGLEQLPSYRASRRKPLWRLNKSIATRHITNNAAIQPPLSDRVVADSICVDRVSLAKSSPRAI